MTTSEHSRSVAEPVESVGIARCDREGYILPSRYVGSALGSMTEALVGRELGENRGPAEDDITREGTHTQNADKCANESLHHYTVAVHSHVQKCTYNYAVPCSLRVGTKVAPICI